MDIGEQRRVIVVEPLEEPGPIKPARHPKPKPARRPAKTPERDHGKAH